MVIYIFTLQLEEKKIKIKCSEWECSQFHLVGKLNHTSYILAARSTSSKVDWELFGNSWSKRNEEMHTTNEGSQMRQETCDVRDRNKFHIDKL